MFNCLKMLYRQLEKGLLSLLYGGCIKMTAKIIDLLKYRSQLNRIKISKESLVAKEKTETDIAIDNLVAEANKFCLLVRGYKNGN